MGEWGLSSLVRDITHNDSGRYAMKVCLMDDDDGRSRFRREVRVMEEFRDNPKVATILTSNLNHDRPYFVMKYYPLGDLTTVIDEIMDDLVSQELLFLEMIACLNELHSKGHFHRDIKPQNFLRDEDKVVIADLGLIRDIHSHTSITRVSERIGTEGYMPPEFRQPGGFINPTAASDIFMFGRTIYYLLSRHDPLYPAPQNITAPIWRVLEKSWQVQKEERFQSLDEMRVSLVGTYDVLLHRINVPVEKALGYLTSLQIPVFQSEAGLSSIKQVRREFMRVMGGLDENEKKEICMKMERKFFENLNQEYESGEFSEILEIYSNMVKSKGYDYSFAEDIAKNMRVIFESNYSSNSEKEHALKLAIRAAHECNRYSAMDTCIALVRGISDTDLALRVAEILSEEMSVFFLSRSTPNDFSSQIIRSKLYTLKEAQENLNN